MKSLRKFMRRSLALLLSLAMVLPASALAADDEDDEGITGEPISIEADTGTPKTLSDDSSITTVNYSVTYGQTSARSILNMVNEFRQSDDAWYWNEDNETKTELKGTLSNLTYDYDLEEIAVQRAAELAIYYSHTRPNGKDLQATFSEYGYGYTSAGENIAAGQKTAEDVFTSWKEEDAYYSGQGHRRAMLSSTYTAIGIGCVYYNGYYYWVQEFAKPTGTINSSGTTANDSVTEVSVEVADDEVTSASLNTSPSSYALPANGTDSLPVISGTIKLTETWPSSKTCSLTSVDAAWSSADSSVASVSDTTVTGLKSGETTLTAEALGESFSVPVSVASLSSATITLSEDSYTYDGSAKTPGVTVQIGSSTLIQGTDYTVSYSNNTNAGTATVTVTGTGDYEGSQELTFTINKASQNLTASLADSSIVVGDTTSITASGEGEISYKSSDNSVATVDGNGTVTGVGVGKATITVTASGNDNYESASEGLDIEVTKKAQTLTASIADSSIAVDGTTTITASGEGEISYKSDHTNVATVDADGVVTGVGVGTATITVTAAGNDEYDSASTTVDIEVVKANQTLTASIEDSSIAVDGTTTITTEGGKGTISYESSDTSKVTVDDSGVVTGVGTGDATITVQAAGNDNYNESNSVNLDITVTKGNQTLTASLASSSIVIGKTTTITASGEGEISYESSDTSVATVDEDGVVTGVNVGTATITVTASGDENYEPASKELSIKVTKESQTLTVSIASSSILVGKTTTITASGEGEISYKSSDTSVATVSSSGVVTGVAAGSATITVTAAGNNNYEAASKTLSIKVTKQDQSLTAKAKSSTIVVGKTTTISASGKGTITYTSSDKKIATVSSSGKVTAKAPGKVTITVKAAGNSNYNSASKKVTIKVNPKAPSIKSAKNSKSKKAAVKWKKVSGVTGYQIQYSTSKSFSSKKSTTVKGASKVSKTLSKLKKGKTYYIRIRAYKTVSGTKYYSSWSSKKSVKIKK